MTIRLARGADAGAIRAVYAPVVRDTAVSFETDPPTADEMRGRIERTLGTHPWLVAERGGEVAGYAYAGPHRKRASYRWCVDVSVYVGEDHRGRGIGRGLYEALLEILRLQGFYNAYAGIALPNPASVGLHESLEFERVGVYGNVGYKRGEWHDVGWWARTLREHDGEPEPPAAVGEVPEEELTAAMKEGSLRAGP